MTYSDSRLQELKSAISDNDNWTTLFAKECSNYAIKNNIVGKLDIENIESLVSLKRIMDESFINVLNKCHELIGN